MKKILKIALKKKIINLIDYYFTYFISKKKNKKIHFIIALISKITNEGNNCLPINKIKKKYIFKKKEKYLIKKTKNIFKKIKKHIKNLLNNKNNICSKGNKITPIVFFKKKLYFYKIWNYEKKISKFLSNNKKSKYFNYQKKEKIFKYFKKNKIKKIQKKIIINALIYKKIIITGNPGTGKTTIAMHIIIISRILKKKKIILTALTGKATILLNETFNKIINKIIIKKKFKKKIKYKCLTLHKLIGLKKKKSKAFYNKKNKLNIDILIVDEVSMINISIMNYLINSLPKNIKIIFLGDVNQLPPINSTSILYDIKKYIKKNIKRYKKINFEKKKINYLISNKNYIKKKKTILNRILILKKKYRFNKNSNINILSKYIKNKKIKKIKKLFKKKIIQIKKIKNKKYLYNIFKKTLNYNYNYNYKNKNILKKIFKNRILCINNKGKKGTKKINKEIDKYIIKNNKIPYKIIKNFIIYKGKPIIITKNNELLKLYNGEIGIIIDNNKVIFYKNKKNIFIPLNSIKNYKTAWAITIHKSQGSEFKNISLILSKKKLYNQLLYTAITRAKKNIFLYGKKKIFIKSCKKINKKYSGIINHLKKYNK
ncbi:exodeoxyribonuclease V subunit alpha [Buchnera aphidicola]|uniref:exodeoxyribonuclease V subunit alpha n=1 Tax=Buchnera aphidicola TaxID=9 RepID=UPI0031B86BDF